MKETNLLEQQEEGVALCEPQTYYAKIRRGARVPHQRHWKVLAQLAEQAAIAQLSRGT